MSLDRVPAGWSYHTGSPRCWASREQSIDLPPRERAANSPRLRLRITARPDRDGGMVRYLVVLIAPDGLPYRQIAHGTVDGERPAHPNGVLYAACEWLDPQIPTWVAAARGGAG